MDVRVRDPLVPLRGGTDLPASSLYVDAGVGNLRFRLCAEDGVVLSDTLVPSNTDLLEVFTPYRLTGYFSGGEDAPVFITGKLAETVRETLGCGKVVLSPALFWLAARDLVRAPANAGVQSLAMIDLSASGYLLIGIDRAGQLKNDLLLVNPRCGAGSGINLDRILQKLGMGRGDVDPLLAAYLGEAGRRRREAATVRADRCGVFSSSATISEKNQGIPLHAALATTLKSEVLKACKRLPRGFEKVYLTGRIFRWQFARDCAEDHLRGLGVSAIEYDTENTQVLESLRGLVAGVGAANLTQRDPRLVRPPAQEEYPGFGELKRRYEAESRYLRLSPEPVPMLEPGAVAQRPVILGLDVGSTMAKAVVADAATGDNLFLQAYSNAGDTIETVKQVFADLRRIGLKRLSVSGIGVTGSARYQVQQALSRIYPEIAGRTLVLVENYAHARGSIDQARRHLQALKARGVQDIDESFCILIDIGGEDTKISTIALEQAELFDNAMNVKCSAGTGSLMDTLSAMFGIPSVEEGCRQAYAAPRSFAINATCAVFLMENARKLKAQGVPQEEILASANWAIVENMARTLWSQLDLPVNAVVLLHGQTMLSEPLPLAVTHRLQSHLGGAVYALVPPHPGHRACIGLIRSLRQAAIPDSAEIPLDRFLDARFEKRIIQCQGAACGDPEARCNRCSLSCRPADGHRFSFTLGGCTAINELLARKGKDKVEQPPDAYKQIWDFLDSRHPRSEAPDRLVIPRSFAVSEWAYFLARIFERLGVPVHVDNVGEGDLLDAQPDFDVDTCAPQMGAVGQYRRLAGQPHGYILAPQIERLPTGGKSSGLTCTVNQGGVAVANNLAELAHPAARFHLFVLNLDRLEPGYLSDQLISGLTPVFRHYGLSPEPVQLERIVEGALEDHRRLREEAADLAADLAEEALAAGRPVALVVGREYVLNPGIYDSHVRRLLRDKGMTVIPSYVLDIELDEDYRHIYWRNPHVILSLLSAVAGRSLHRRLRQPRLRELFRRLETDPQGRLLPVTQVSTFSCGPDSVTAHHVAEIMKQRPFLLIQSDAVLKELAHLENRVNTYVKQLEQGLHGKLRIGAEGPFSVRTLDQLESREPLNRDTDVLYFPTLSDNRVLCAVFRGAGYTCIDNYDDASYDLQALVKAGRKVTGDSVCAPLAAMYADLVRAVEDFTRRKQAGDPLVARKRRLLFFDSQGGGPCRQGQYPRVHKILFAGERQRLVASATPGSACNTLSGGEVVQLLMAREEEGYDAGFEEWVLLRAYQGAILQGVLHGLLFSVGTLCTDYEEYRRLLDDYRGLKAEVYGLLESYSGPGPLGRRVLALVGRRNWIGLAVKYFLYRLRGREFLEPLRRFHEKWIAPKPPLQHPFRILASGEGYMRIAQAEDVFRVLLATLGFRRFHYKVTPAMSFMEYLLDEAELKCRAALAIAEAKDRRLRDSKAGEGKSRETADQAQRLRFIKGLRFFLRQLLARPLYRAAGLHMPPSGARLICESKELLPTSRPIGELAPYMGEALHELREGVDLLLNVGPSGCLVSSMGEVLTPSIMAADGVSVGRIQHLFSAEGDVDEELLTLAVLKALGPERYYRASSPTQATVQSGIGEQATDHCV